MRKPLILLAGVLMLISCSQGGASSEEATAPTQEQAAEQPEMTEEESLQTAADANPDDLAANYNLAIYYYNQGVEMIESMPYKDEVDSVEFEGFMKVQNEVMEVFRKALPYAQKAHEIDSTNKNTMTMLSGIYFGLNDMDASLKFKEMLNDTSNMEMHAFDQLQ